MNNEPNKKINYLKIHLLLLITDFLALGSYFGFEELSEINLALSISASEIIVNEGSFFTFIILYLIFFHLLIIISTHTRLSKKAYREKFFVTSIVAGFFLFFFSGYFVSSYVENKLTKADYHFCANLSYTEAYKSTHYVWRAKNESCNSD